VAYFKSLSRNFPEGTEKTTKTSIRTAGLRGREPRNSRIRRSFNHSTTRFSLIQLSDTPSLVVPNTVTQHSVSFSDKRRFCWKSVDTLQFLKRGHSHPVTQVRNQRGMWVSSLTPCERVKIIAPRVLIPTILPLSFPHTLLSGHV
jgi:hypothetical protein